MKKLALVLGGGASKGYAHIGVLKVLEDNGIKPSLIVGTSMGAIIGGAYTSGLNCDYLIEISKKLTRKKLMDFNLFSTFFSSSIMSGKKLKRVLKQEIGDITHADLYIPFVAIATDIMDGKLVILKQGDVVDNILASSAIPGVYPIVQKNNQTLCDGGLLNNVPDDIARDLRHDYIVLSVDVIADYKKQVESSKIKIMGLTINALTLMQTQITKLKGNNSDLRVNISQPDVSQMSFDEQSIKKSIEYGEISMQKNISKLKKLLQD
ncbi:MAG: patatin-like phospholipase family protein [Clostridia bacterium]|nr:patatin-like phospholipase family protein [Clostridia bacterium]